MNLYAREIAECLVGRARRRWWMQRGNDRVASTCVPCCSSRGPRLQSPYLFITQDEPERYM